ncbi:Rab1a [Hexamita inflata]|uniref:Rab1a n=1 Tax=Hexamita inflata TaxID=28002 RepID=A0AA86R7Z8_9EUKA|nr:Rab1a [Hexamita inflata]
MNIKLALVGQSGCGKSSILYRIQRDAFAEVIPTQSLELMQKKMQFNDSTVNLQLIDTVGQEQFNSISPQFYRNLNAIGITCDSVQSLEKANYWYAQSKQNNEAAKIYFILSKSDQQNIQEELLLNFAAEKQIPLLKMSALTGEGINIFVQTVLKDTVVFEDKEVAEPMKKIGGRVVCF